MAQPLVWARGRGCSFATGECVGSSGTLAGFCESADDTGCTADHKAKGACNLISYTSDLPTSYQWFPSDPTSGGNLATADYCPYFAAYSNGDCDATANAPAANYRAESYGASSLCFNSSLMQPVGGYILTSSQSPACYQTRCSTAGVLELRIVLQDTTEHWLSCPSPGDAAIPPEGADIRGTVTCPSLSIELLCSPHACPGLECDNTDACNGGVCTCGAAFGTTCLSVTASPSTPPSPPSSPPSPSMPPSTPVPPASPPPPPPPLPPLPPHPSPAMTTLISTFEASGDVSDYDDARQDGIKAVISDAAGVPSSSILLQISSGSVLVTSTILLLADDASSTAATLSAGIFASPAALGSALSAAGVSGVTISAISQPETVSLSPPPSSPPPDSPQASSNDVAVIAGAAGGAAGGVLVIMAVGFYIYRRSSTPKVMPSSSA